MDDLILKTDELKAIYNEIQSLSLLAEEKEMDCSEIDPETLNFQDYSERFEIFLDLLEDLKNGTLKNVGDIDLAGLSGIDDESDLEFDPDAQVDADFLSDYADDFEDYFDESLSAFKNCLGE